METSISVHTTFSVTTWLTSQIPAQPGKLVMPSNERLREEEEQDPSQATNAIQEAGTDDILTVVLALHLVQLNVSAVNCSVIHSTSHNVTLVDAADTAHQYKLQKKCTRDLCPTAKFHRLRVLSAEALHKRSVPT